MEPGQEDKVLSTQMKETKSSGPRPGFPAFKSELWHLFQMETHLSLSSGKDLLICRKSGLGERFSNVFFSLNTLWPEGPQSKEWLRHQPQGQAEVLSPSRTQVLGCCQEKLLPTNRKGEVEASMILLSSCGLGQVWSKTMMRTAFIEQYPFCYHDYYLIVFMCSMQSIEERRSHTDSQTQAYAHKDTPLLYSKVSKWKGRRCNGRKPQISVVDLAGVLHIPAQRKHRS